MQNVRWMSGVGMQSNIAQFCSGVRAVPKVSPHEFQTCWRVLIGQNFFKGTTGDLEFVWLVFVSRVVSRFHLHRKRINFAAINLDQFAVERLAVPPGATRSCRAGAAHLP